MQDVENQASVTVNAALDALGDRLASGTSSAYAWLIPDLHGNVVGQLNSSGSTVTDAFRYDAYGLTEGTPPYRLDPLTLALPGPSSWSRPAGVATCTTSWPAATPPISAPSPNSTPWPGQRPDFR